MKKILIPILATILLVACKKTDTAFVADCSSGTKSFVTDVKPLVLTACSGGSNCHGSGSHKGPGELLNYAQISMDKSEIRSDVVAGRMPQGMTLTTAEKNTIVCWIDNGALNN
jgi:hypothetical protein